MLPRWSLVFVTAALFFPMVQAAAQQPDLRRYSLEPDASRIFVVTHRSGLLSFLGHDHAILPTDWRAELCLAEPVPEGAHGSLVVRTESLVIDSDSARALAGLDEGPGAEDRAEIQQKMLAPANLAADRHPEIRLDLQARDSATDGRFTADGTLTLRGVEQDVETRVSVEEMEDESRGIRLSGQLEIGQRAFGIEPESVAGVVNVANEVDLHFSLAAARTDRPCQSD